MRVLFSTTAGAGHFGPMVPFARACRDAGHEVKVAAPASFAQAVAGAGLEHAPFADVPPEVLGPIFGRLPQLSRVEADRIVMAEVFGRLGAQAALPGLMALMADWRPDVVVREFCEFGSLVAAEKAGVPQVEVAISLAAAVDSALPVVAPALAELEAIAGLLEGAAYRALALGPVLSCVPAEVDGEETHGRAIQRLRDSSLTAVEGSPPPPWGVQDHPLVYITFGSVTAGLAPFAGIYRSVLDALADEPLRVLMTTGTAIEPGTLAPWPANARVEQWRAQAGVIPYSQVVVGHGGFGTTIAALAGGVPQVVIPLFAADQFVNAERVAAMRTGVCLDGGPEAVPALAPALAEVLGDPAYDEKARGVAAAMHKLPDVASSVSFLEQLVGTGAGWQRLGADPKGPDEGLERTQRPRTRPCCEDPPARQ